MTGRLAAPAPKRTSPPTPRRWNGDTSAAASRVPHRPGSAEARSRLGFVPSHPITKPPARGRWGRYHRRVTVSAADKSPPNILDKRTLMSTMSIRPVAPVLLFDNRINQDSLGRRPLLAPFADVAQLDRLFDKTPLSLSINLPRRAALIPLVGRTPTYCQTVPVRGKPAQTRYTALRKGRANAL